MALVADVRRADPSPELLHLWWLGQAGFLVAHRGRHLLVDPYLSDTLTEKYAGTPTPHERIGQRVAQPAELAFAEGVLATHHHTDHLDPGTLAPLLRAAPAAVLVAPSAHRALACERAEAEPERVLGLDDGEVVEVAGMRVRAVPAAHETIERDDAGRMLALGYVVEAGPFRLLHTGDTVPYPGQVARAGRVDVALLPINGRGIPGTPGNLDAEEAAALAAALPARVAVPCHFGMFAFNTAAPEPFAAACACLGVDARVLRAGERLTLQAATDASASTARR